MNSVYTCILRGGSTARLYDVFEANRDRRNKPVPAPVNHAHWLQKLNAKEVRNAKIKAAD